MRASARLVHPPPQAFDWSSLFHQFPKLAFSNIVCNVSNCVEGRLYWLLVVALHTTIVFAVTQVVKHPNVLNTVLVSMPLPAILLQHNGLGQSRWSCRLVLQINPRKRSQLSPPNTLDLFTMSQYD